MRARVLTASIVVTLSVAAGGAQSWKNVAPESFRINTQITDGPGGAGGVASAMEFRVERYTSDAEHEVLVTALKSGGYDAFVQALHKAPKVGVLQSGKRSLDVRWARFQPAGDGGRRIIAVTDGPVYFFGAGAVDAKPTKGYDIGVIEFTVDSVGLGRGSMAGAARVKPGGPSGVEVDDYSGKRIELTTVSRNVSNPRQP